LHFSTLLFKYKKSPSKSFGTALKIIRLFYAFFHPDLNSKNAAIVTVGFGISSNLPKKQKLFRLVGFTTGRELHPSLKIFITLILYLNSCFVNILF